MIELAWADDYAPRLFGLFEFRRWDASGLLGHAEWRGWTVRVWRLCLVVDVVKR